MDKSENWENERFIYEKLKQTRIFRTWKHAQFDCQLGKCAWCGKPMQYRYAETDHVKPLYYGGKSEASNLVLCHHKCNKDKSTVTNYERPDWIKANCYDHAVTEKYEALVNEYLPNGPLPDSSFSPIDSENRNTETNVVPLGTKRFPPSSKLLIVVAITVSIAVFLPILLSSGMNPATKNNTKDNDAQKNDTETVVRDEDGDRKSYAKYIVGKYDDFYNDWVVKRGYKLPSDASGCTKWNGCSLSFPYEDTELPSDYTYSINTLDDGAVFSQNGAEPHATMYNVALYKRARCGQDGAVIGGQIDKNAAAVVRLSNGSYYCAQN